MIKLMIIIVWGRIHNVTLVLVASSAILPLTWKPVKLRDIGDLSSSGACQCDSGQTDHFRVRRCNV